MKVLDLSAIEAFLSQRLLIPLPGRDAQALMAPRPIEESRFKENPKYPAKPSGVMILLYPKNGELYLPLMKRPSYDGAHSGQVSFPGGKVEETDKDLIETALRETEEEIGVDRNEISVIGQLTDLYIIASNFKVSPSLGLLSYTPAFKPDSYEVESVLEVPIKQLWDTARQGVQEMKFGKHIIQSPFFEIEGHLVWGATAMMLSELMEIIKDIEA
ncbi:MAG: 8-oxo-dGTP pyrophosphatase MutT (NUDIX family) [Roseivirga sp.]|jgi:8-oxo-dGTP pyrophosphatase MutT (NUDIX family)